MAKKPTRRAPAKKKAASTAKKSTTAAKKPASRAKKPAAPVKAPRRNPAIGSVLRKKDLIDLISSEASLPKDSVRKVLDAQDDVIERSLRPRGGCGVAQIGNLIKIERYKRPATKKRMGRNLRTGEEIVIPARRAHNSVKLKKLKRLKDMV